MNQPHRTALTLEGTPLEGGAFEILAITAGEANGWQFGAEALRESLPLWDGVECYIDHPAPGQAPSLRDLAGLCAGPVWDEERQGIRLRLTPRGPSGPLLQAVGRELLAGGRQPKVGFSADLLFTANGSRVERVLRVYSVDLVCNPARGGAFLRALNQLQPTQSSQGGTQMDSTETRVNEQAAPDQTPERETALSQRLLEAALAGAHLPAPAAELVREQFAGRSFDPGELDAAIAAQRRLVGALTAAGSVQGLPPSGQVSGVYDSADQIQAALHDLLGAPRPAGLEGVHAARLSGIRELYSRMTGDPTFSGRVERDRLATSADLPELLRNALNRLVLVQWEELGRAGYRWWEPVVQVEHFNSLQEISGVLVGEVSELPTVAEGAPYPPLDVVDSAETGQWVKYGGYIGLTLEMFERDQTHKLRQYPRKLASAALRRISALVGSVFAGAGPQMSDGLPVFHAGHGNTAPLALDPAGWEQACQAIYNQPLLAPGPGGPLLALDARYCVVPRALRLPAMQVLYPAFSHEANIFSENLQRGEMGDVITCPEMTAPDEWVAVADPRLAPAVIVGERFGLMPEIYVADQPTGGALFTHDEIRMKVRHWVSVFVADYRPLFKAAQA